MVFKSSTHSYDFDCICGHIFVRAISSINSGCWCPYCSNPPKLLCDNEHCVQCFEKSFANHSMSKYWSIDNNEIPRDVFRFSNKYYIFDCHCGHKFNMQLYHINDNTCPYCNHQKLCNLVSCVECYKNSFASYNMSQFWSIKNDINPRMAFKNSEARYIFDCPYCNNEYIPTLSTVANGSWCSCTVNKTETKLYEWLKQNYNLNIEKGKKFEWCKNITYLPFDFYVDEYKLIVELDGYPHFKQTLNWTPPDEYQKRDKYKMNCANANGCSVIRIYQPDVWFDKNDWESNLKNAIKKYEVITNIMIGDIYKNYPIYSQ